MSIFSRLLGKKCERFFTYETIKLDIKGLKSGVKDFTVDIGNITIDKKVIEAKKEELQRLDLLQYSVCNDIQNLPKNSEDREELIKRSIEIKLEMLSLIYNKHSEINKPKDTPQEKNEIKINPPILRVNLDINNRKFFLEDNEEVMSLFVNKAKYLHKKGENFCTIEVLAEKKLLEEKIKLENGNQNMKAEKEIFEIIRLLDSCNDFKKIIIKKIKILLETIAMELVDDNVAYYTDIIRSVINNHEVTNTGISQYYNNRQGDETIKLEVYNNLKDMSNMKIQIIVPIFISDKDLKIMYKKDPLGLKLSYESFISTLMIPGNYFLNDLLTEDMIIRKVLPRYINEVYQLQERVPDLMGSNKSVWANLTNFYVGLG